MLDEQALERAVDKALAKLRSGTDRHADRRMHIERELSLIESKLGRWSRPSRRASSSTFWSPR